MRDPIQVTECVLTGASLNIGNLTLRKATTPTILFRFLDRKGDPADVSGLTLLLRAYSEGAPIWPEKMGTPGAEPGEIAVAFTLEETAPFAGGRFYCELDLVALDGTVPYGFTGHLRIEGSKVQGGPIPPTPTLYETVEHARATYITLSQVEAITADAQTAASAAAADASSAQEARAAAETAQGAAEDAEQGATAAQQAAAASEGAASASAAAAADHASAASSSATAAAASATAAAGAAASAQGSAAAAAAAQAGAEAARDETAASLSDVLARLSELERRQFQIGIPGTQGFGVGICPGPLPSGCAAMAGTADPASDNYGNYQFSDGSVMCWIPAFYYKIGTGLNGLPLNRVDVKPWNAYPDVATANAAGYALHRAFYDGGKVQPGFFVDKYLCSNNGGVASSVKNGDPLSSSGSHNPFAGLTGAPANAYYGAVAAAKTRGPAFFCQTIFIQRALALLSLAHGQAATSSAWCAWYDAAGTKNFPKGNNNDALKDTNDTAVTYVSDGYENCGKTGSGEPFAKTTHNGQNCGVCDLNGNLWEIALGFTSDGVDFFALKTSAAAKDLTGGNSAATDAWGPAGRAALFDNLGPTVGAITGANTNLVFGSAAQVLSEAVSGADWVATGAGLPRAGGVGGSNMFGSDYCYDKRPDDLCPLLGGAWSYGGDAGVWAVNLNTVRNGSHSRVGCRAASYL